MQPKVLNIMYRQYTCRSLESMPNLKQVPSFIYKKETQAMSVCTCLPNPTHLIPWQLLHIHDHDFRISSHIYGKGANREP